MNKRYATPPLLLMILSLLFMMAVNCDRKSEAMEKMDTAEKLMNASPDSALLLLNAINSQSLGSSKEKARYAILKSMALDKNYVDTTVFDVIQPAIDYYLKKGSADDRLRTLYYQGRIYQNKGENDSAMLCFLRGREYCEQATDTFTAANLMAAQAVIQYKMYKFDDFIRNNLAAASKYHDIGRYDYEAQCVASALDGALLNNDKSLADSIAMVAHELMETNPSVSADITPFILSYAVKYGKDTEVVELLNIYNSVDSMDDMTKMNIACIYYRLDDHDKARSLLESIPISSDIRKTMKYQAVYARILEHSGEAESAIKAYRTFYHSLDSIHHDIFSHDILFIKEKYELEKANMNRINSQNYKIWLSLCLILILLFISGTVFHSYRLATAKSMLNEKEKDRLRLLHENLRKENENLELQRQNALMEKRTAEMENERKTLEAENLRRENKALDKKISQSESERINLEQTNRNLELEKQKAMLEMQNAELEKQKQVLESENLRMQVKQLEEEGTHLKEILSQQEDLAKPVEEIIRTHIKMLMGLLAEQITSNDKYARPYKEWSNRLTQNRNEFMSSTRLAYTAIYPNTLKYLKQHDLTEAEINYICLYAIGLRGKEVGEYIQLKRHYHISSDIRKKLGLDEHETNLGIYIRNLMKQMG